MKVSNISFAHYKKPYYPKGSYETRSISSNTRIPIETMWDDLDEYVKTQDGLSERNLTKNEMFVYAHLPNVELKRMYVNKILSTNKNKGKI